MFSKTIDSKSTFIDKFGNVVKDLTESIFCMISYNLNLVSSYYRVSKDLEMRPDKISYALYGTDDYAEIVMKHSGIDNPFAIEEGDFLSAPSLNTIYSNIKDLTDFQNSGDYTNDAANNANTVYDLVKKYHKYIDKSKLPDSDSQISVNDIPSIEIANEEAKQNRISAGLASKNGIDSGNSGNSYSAYSSDSAGNVSNSPSEANLANSGRSGITVSNGRIYFGDKVSASTENLADIITVEDASSNLVDCAKNGVTLGQFLTAVIKNNVNSK